MKEIVEFEEKFGITEKRMRVRLRDMSEQEFDLTHQTVVFLGISSKADKVRMEIVEEIHDEKNKESKQT